MGLKEELLHLLKTDEEFRYAVAGLLGYDEILKRVRRQEKQIAKLRREMYKSLARLSEAVEKLAEIATKHTEEITRLRAEMLEGFKRHDEEIAQLRREMLEGFKRHDELYAKLAEAVAKLGEEVARLDKRITGLHSALLAGLGEVSKFAGLTFEELVRKLLTAQLRGTGTIPPDAELRAASIDGEQVDIFLEDPLVVGEVTSYAETAEEASKLLRKAEAARRKFGREPLKFLVILTARREAARELERIARENNIELTIGKIVED
ncbi:MAG: hypothetical protein QXN73_07325 [Thermofilaceae archaeon]